MKEGFTFKWASLKFLRKVIFKNFGGGGENRKEPISEMRESVLDGNDKTTLNHTFRKIVKLLSQSNRFIQSVVS